MPLPAEISIPGYLEPPSQAQREQLDMAQQQLREKAAAQMQRRIAMAKLMGDANQLQAAGLDPTEARQQALVKNAPSLFPDDPETMLHITTQVQTALARKKAIQDYKDELASGIAQKLNPEEAAARAWAKYGPDISTAGFFPGLTRLQTTQEQLDLRRQQMQQQQEEFKAREERIKTLKAQELEQKGLELGERTRVNDARLGLEERKVQVQEKKADQATGKGGKLSDVQKEKIRTLRGMISEMTKAKAKFEVDHAKDPELRSKRFAMAVRIGNLQKEIDAIMAESGGGKSDNQEGSDQSSPSPDEFEYDLETRSLRPKAK